jgi:diguanylate cyclase (GGDEF)-like protein/PAS domain S-box-containing protein
MEKIAIILKNKLLIPVIFMIGLFFSIYFFSNFDESMGGVYLPSDIHALKNLIVILIATLIFIIYFFVIRNYKKNLDDSKLRFRELFNLIPDGLLICNAGKIIFSNIPASYTLGYEYPTDLYDKQLSKFFNIENWKLIEFSMNKLQDTKATNVSVDVTYINADGTQLHLEFIISQIFYDNKNCHLFMLYDITERKNIDQDIKYYAYHDALTGLPNRKLFCDRLSQTQIMNKRKKLFGAIIFIDLDDFKAVNDLHGHGVGDKLLIQVGEQIKASIRESDTVSRMGGDEFVVLLAELSIHRDEAQNQAKMIGDKILMAINKTYVIKHVDYKMAASLGGVIFEGTNSTIEDLLMAADLSMYRSKNNGRNRLSFGPEGGSSPSK